MRRFVASTKKILVFCVDFYFFRQMNCGNSRNGLLELFAVEKYEPYCLRNIDEVQKVLTNTNIGIGNEKQKVVEIPKFDGFTSEQINNSIVALHDIGENTKMLDWDVDEKN